MAPMAFGDKINLYSMIGTWLGTFFTLFGLVTVIAQLRTLLKDLSVSRDETAKAAAGIWAVCLPKLKRSDNGVIEGQAPSLRAWIYHYYNEATTLAVCPYERKQFSGNASWSQLFCRLQIFPEDLLNPGKRDEKTSIPLLAPTTADILFDGPKISYGLPGEDFAALLILSSFSPSDFDAKEARTETSHLGDMHLAAQSDPFSQIAKMDNASWNTLSTFPGVNWEGRHADQLNVRHCLDLALGILRINCAGKTATLLFCSGDADTRFTRAPVEFFPFAINETIADKVSTPYQFFWLKPSAQQIVEIRRRLTGLTGGSIEQNPIHDITTRANPIFHEVFWDSRAAWTGLPFNIDLTDAQVDAAFEIAFGLNALKPWGLPAVIPRSIVVAFCPFLHDSFTRRRATTPISMLNGTFTKTPLAPSTPPTLIKKFRELSEPRRSNVPHRTHEAMDSALDSLSEVETRNFLGLSSRCSLYFDAMIYVFENNGIKLEDVGTVLAAQCAAGFAAQGALSRILTKNQPAASPEILRWEVKFRGFLRECLKGSQMEDIEPWACEILAVYLHAWLQESKDITEGFLENFRRRVFLG